MIYKEKLQKNINKNYIFVFLRMIDLTQGIWMIYLAMKGMSLLQLGILEGIFHLTSFMMEIPTGAVADIYGRKISRIAGRVFALIHVAILMVSNEFYMFALAFIFSAISYNLESGAGEALVYDSLKEIDQENKYMKVTGMQEVVFQIGRVVAYIIGGYLATKSYKLAFIITMGFGILSIIQAFSFEEPKIKNEHKNETNAFEIFKSQLTESIGILKGNKKIGFLIIFSEAISVFGTSLFYYLQNYLKGNGYDEFKIGLMFAISALVSAFVASQAYKIENIIKERGVLLIMPIINIVCLWGIALTEYHYIFYILMMAVEGIIFVAVSDYVNKLIPSENRATILSFSSMVFSAFMIIIFPVIGKIGDVYSLEVAFKLLAIIGTGLGAINTYLLLKGEKQLNKLK